jgi:hypothetical protein
MSEQPVVVATPTIMDGTVVRWHRNMSAYAHGQVSVSASRHRVSIHDDEFQTLPREWVDLALDVHRQLARDPKAPVGHVITHRHQGLGGPLVPVQAEV